MRKYNAILRVIGIQNPSNFDCIYDKLFSFLAETYPGGMRHLLNKAVNGEIEIFLTNFENGFKLDGSGQFGSELTTKTWSARKKNSGFRENIILHFISFDVRLAF